MKSILVAINSKYVHTALGLRYVNEFCRKKRNRSNAYRRDHTNSAFGGIGRDNKSQARSCGIFCAYLE